jgi:hypothetical protein
MPRETLSLPARHSTRRVRREDGAAIVMTMMAVALLSSLGAGLLLTSSSEAIMAGHFREQRSAFYAAEAIVERALVDAAAVPDWNTLIDGSTRSSFVDGPPAGTRTLEDGSVIDLAQVVNLANCQKRSACAAADLSAVTAQRPWGVNNPRWQLYAHGPLRAMLPGDIDSPWYVVVMVADDPAAATDIVALRAEAFGPRSAHSIVELTAARTGYDDVTPRSAVRTLSWREVR